MRYIRTKDGIYNTTKLMYAFNEEYISKDWNKDFEKLLQTSILKQANDIKELCDVFIVIAFFKGQQSSDIPDFFSNLYLALKRTDNLRHLGYDSQVYGAIWIIGKFGEPILKPVAKMNKDGVLCLIN